MLVTFPRKKYKYQSYNSYGNNSKKIVHLDWWASYFLTRQQHISSPASPLELTAATNVQLLANPEAPHQKRLIKRYKPTSRFTSHIIFCCPSHIHLFLGGLACPSCMTIHCSALVFVPLSLAIKHFKTSSVLGNISSTLQLFFSIRNGE